MNTRDTATRSQVAKSMVGHVNSYKIQLLSCDPVGATRDLG